MGLFDRFRATGRSAEDDEVVDGVGIRATAHSVSAQVFGGDDDLEVVGEATYQDALWTICRGAPGDRVRQAIVAILVPEPQNPYDVNAIAVHVSGFCVGYLARDVAAAYARGLGELMSQCGNYVALRGVIVGGGYYDDGPGRLGVWLEHDSRDFGLEPVGSRWSGPAARAVPTGGTMRTGFTEAWLTDVEDDSYDLSWFNELPDADQPAIAMLRELLATDPDPIDRHFQFAELETRLYRCRDLLESALAEFDDACRSHDVEMDTICVAFKANWGKVPLLETYRQMSIRQQKIKNWDACLWWAERGLEIYGNDAAREDAVEDLLKRRNRALAKLEASSKASTPDPSPIVTAAVAETSAVATSPPAAEVARTAAEIEVLVCSRCGGAFERLRVRGRKPLLCPECRAAPAP